MAFSGVFIKGVYMRNNTKIGSKPLWLGLLLVLASACWGQKDGQRIPKLKKVFVLSNGGPVHWHETVARGSEIMRDLAKGQNPDNHTFEVFITEAPADLTAAKLAGVQVLVMNNVSAVGRLLNNAQKTVVENFVKAGGGTAGWHGTTDTGGAGSWPWFVNWISAQYVGSAKWVPATMTRTDASYDPKYKDILGNLPKEFQMEAEEWYQYNSPAPEDNKKNVVLLGVNPKDVSSTKASLPYIWVNDTEYPGRFWESGFGHLQSILAREDIVEMFYRGVTWAGGGYDLAGCMIKTDVKYNPAATIPCANCCGSVPILVKSGLDAGNTGSGFTENLAGDFSVTINEKGNHSVRVYDVHGKLVAQKASHVPARYAFPEIAKAGIYFVRISTSKQKITKRVKRI